MAKKKKSAKQWKVLQNIHVGCLERELEQWTGKGWTVHSIHGPQGMMTVVLNRLLTL